MDTYVGSFFQRAARLDERAGDGNALPLPARQQAAPVAHLRGVPARSKAGPCVRLQKQFSRVSKRVTDWEHESARNLEPADPPGQVVQSKTCRSLQYVTELTVGSEFLMSIGDWQGLFPIDSYRLPKAN